LAWVRDNVEGHQDENDDLSLVQLRARKLRAESELLELRRERERGNLVDRHRAERLVMDMSSQVKEAWLNFPSRAAPEMAAELNIGVSDLQSVLDKYVRQYLQAMSDSAVNLSES
jgi:hypothetical protein